MWSWDALADRREPRNIDANPIWQASRKCLRVTWCANSNPADMALPFGERFVEVQYDIGDDYPSRALGGLVSVVREFRRLKSRETEVDVSPIVCQTCMDGVNR